MVLVPFLFCFLRDGIVPVGEVEATDRVGCPEMRTSSPNPRLHDSGRAFVPDSHCSAGIWPVRGCLGEQDVGDVVHMCS